MNASSDTDWFTISFDSNTSFYFVLFSLYRFIQPAKRGSKLCSLNLILQRI